MSAPLALDSAGRWRADTARLGMWIFLATEVLFFGGLLLAYLYGRVHWPEGFRTAGRHTDVALGTINTTLLLSASALVATAVACDEHEAARHQAWRLLATAAGLGAAFLAIKGFEYAQDWREGLLPGPGFALAGTPGAELFFMLYFVTTGLHALHLIVGMGVLATFSRARAKHARWANPHRLEVAGLYWHFVDVVWIVLYPLLYLVGRST